MVQSLAESRRRQPTMVERAAARIPPHNLEAESSLIGAVLLSRDALTQAIELVGAEDFYKPSHGHIFSACVELWRRGEPVDAITVADELKRMGLLDVVGGSSVLLEVQAGTPAIASAPRYAKLVSEYALMRRLIGCGQEIAEMAYEPTSQVDDVLDRAETMVFEVANRKVGDSVASIRTLIGDSLDVLERLFERGEAITGVPTGYRDLDEQLAGLQKANLVVVGARPSMGKTSFALGLAANAAAAHQIPVLLFSLEMSRIEITNRLLCSFGQVDATHMRNGRLQERDWLRINQAVARLGDAPLYVDDSPNLTVMDIRAKARRLASRQPLGLVVVDYLQLMTGRNQAENRQVEVSEISRGLKILARELEVPVVALSQLSRNLEMRADKRPVLADLRESGSIEQDADVVLFIYRDEVYNQASEDRGTAEIIVAKHRNGPTGVTRLAFIEKYARFVDIAQV